MFRCAVRQYLLVKATIGWATDSGLFLVRGEITRFREDLRQWREAGEGLEKVVAGWGGVVFTVVTVLYAGYGAAETVDDILGNAITPLAVLWGLQHYPRTSLGDSNRPPEGPDYGTATLGNSDEGDEASPKWVDRFRGGVTKLCQLSGIVGVIAILLLGAADPLIADSVVRPIAVLSGSVAMMSAIARITANEAPRYVIGESPLENTEHLAILEARLGAVMWDGFVVLGASFVIGIGLSLVWEEFSTTWANGLAIGVWILYQSVTIRLWGRGVGGRRKHLQVLDLEGRRPGWGRSFAKATITLVPLVALGLFLSAAESNLRLIYSVFYSIVFVGVFVVVPRRAK